MKVTVGQIAAAIPVLSKLKEENLPIKLSYRLSRIVEHFSKPYLEFEDIRMALVKKYGVEKDDGHYEVEDDQRTGFYQELATVLEEPLEVPVPLIPVELFPKDITITPTDMLSINFLVEEPM